MRPKPIDPVAIKQAVKEGQLVAYVKNGNIYIKDGQTEECVCIGKVEEENVRKSD